MPNTRLFRFRPEPPDDYEGLPVGAHAGVHEQAAALLRRHVPAGARVLDLGAGTGAFATRLSHAGYAVTAVDVDGGRWGAEGVPFRALDVEAGLPAEMAGAFDAVCCLEVIEHVENPWRLLREAAAAARAGGYLVLSTPNVSSFLSRLVFLLHGRFAQFQEENLAYGHITPLTAFAVETAARRAGWSVLEVHPGGDLPVFDLSRRTPRMLAFNCLRGLAYLAARGPKDGWSLLFVMRRAGSRDGGAR